MTGSLLASLEYVPNNSTFKQRAGESRSRTAGTGDDWKIVPFTASCHWTSPSRVDQFTGSNPENGCSTWTLFGWQLEKPNGPRRLFFGHGPILLSSTPNGAQNFPLRFGDGFGMVLGYRTSKPMHPASASLFCARPQAAGKGTGSPELEGTNGYGSNFSELRQAAGFGLCFH